MSDEVKWYVHEAHGPGLETCPHCGFIGSGQLIAPATLTQTSGLCMSHFEFECAVCRGGWSLSLGTSPEYFYQEVSVEPRNFEDMRGISSLDDCQNYSEEKVTRLSDCDEECFPGFDIEEIE